MRRFIVFGLFSVFSFLFGNGLTLLGLQSRFGGNWGQITWNLTALSPHRDWSSKGVLHSRVPLFTGGHRPGGSSG